MGVCSKSEVPRHLGETKSIEPNKLIRRQIHASPTVGTPKSSSNSHDHLFVRNFQQCHEARALEPLTERGRDARARHQFSGSCGLEQAHNPHFIEVQPHKVFIDQGWFRFDADFVDRAEIVIREEIVDSQVAFRRIRHLFCRLSQKRFVSLRRFAKYSSFWLCTKDAMVCTVPRAKRPDVTLECPI